MAYTVAWLPEARRQLTEIWINATLRQDVADAANRIDRALSESPTTLGESRGGNRRILFEFPLLVVYEVSEPDRLVRVALVRNLSHDPT